ncbi:MAG: pyridoxal-dependent decarboxylase [Acidobacteria bacterium]|nr:pyridoxal-dependent decarboxylase [Acidobacteriota bacterium]
MSETKEHESDAVEDEAGRRRSSLELEAEEWRKLVSQAQALVTDYFAQVAELQIFPQEAVEEFPAIFSHELPEEGSSVEEIISGCRAVAEASRHSGHPRFFGYVASSASPVGVVGDFIASALNQNLTAWRSAPAATEVERTVVAWLSKLIGYAERAGGLLTSGGSMANLNALYIAHRAKAGARASLKGLWHTEKPLTIYASEQVHLSIEKAADVLGLGREQVRPVSTDEKFRLDVRALRERIASDVRQGLRPFCVVASAGTVATGAVDPLREIAGVAREHDLWFHIDGAYGALGAVDEQSRALFDGMELADSISLDPHKWLYAPIDCGCLLLREPERARAAFSQGEAEYIKVYEQDEREAFAFWDYGVELTRRFRALKVWMMLCYYGSRRLSEAIAEDIALAKYLGEEVEAAEDFELLAPVELSICCFRYVPKSLRDELASASDEAELSKINHELDHLNERVMHKLQRGGRAYLSNASLRGRFALRACLVNFRTTRQDLSLTLDIVREAAQGLVESEQKG